MGSPVKAAIVMCHGAVAGDAACTAVDRTLLGLTVGERVLLALAHSGVEQVAFAGSGPRPTSDRARLREVSVSELPADEDVIVVASDAVFDRGLVSEGDIPAGLPIHRARPGDVDAAAQLPTGRADSGRGFAIRVTDRANVRRARRALLLSLRKPIDGLVSRFLNRYVSTFLSRFLVSTRLAPNVFTVVFLLIGLASAVFATQAQHWWALVVAGGLFQAQSILDGCDGEVARLTYRFSRVGQWLDSIGDDLTNYAFCLGLAIGQARVLDSPQLYWAGGFVFGAQLLMAFILYRRMVIMGTGDLLAIPDMVTGTPGDGTIDRVMSGFRLLAKRDTFVFILAAFTAAQLPLVAFCIFAAGTPIMLVGVAVNERRIVAAESVDPSDSQVGLGLG